MTTLFDLRKSRIVAEVGGLMALVDTLEIQLATPGRPPTNMDAIVAELTDNNQLMNRYLKTDLPILALLMSF